MRWRAAEQNNVQQSGVSGDDAVAALWPAVMTGTDWNHTQPLGFWPGRRIIQRTQNYSNCLVFICIPQQIYTHIHAHTPRKGKKRLLFSCKPPKSWKHTHRNTTHTHCTEGLWECSTGICPKSEIIAAERMKQCKLIKDKNCLLLNRLKGNLIVLLCLWDSSGSWENTVQLLC